LTAQPQAGRGRSKTARREASRQESIVLVHHGSTWLSSGLRSPRGDDRGDGTARPHLQEQVRAAPHRWSARLSHHSRGRRCRLRVLGTLWASRCPGPSGTAGSSGCPWLAGTGGSARPQGQTGPKGDRGPRDPVAAYDPARACRGCADGGRMSAFAGVSAVTFSDNLPQGERGPAGVLGVRGLAGSPGPAGSSGPPGPVGAKGPRGDQGPMGLCDPRVLAR
jgi:hypothetical protein